MEILEVWIHIFTSTQWENFWCIKEYNFKQILRKKIHNFQIFASNVFRFKTIWSKIFLILKNLRQNNSWFLEMLGQKSRNFFMRRKVAIFPTVRCLVGQKQAVLVDVLATWKVIEFQKEWIDWKLIHDHDWDQSPYFLPYVSWTTNKFY